MPVGLAAIAQANQDMICMSSKESVRRISMGWLLEQRLEIPMFQRRYCWCDEQWKILLSDVSVLAAGLKEVHPLGRLTCAVRDDPREAGEGGEPGRGGGEGPSRVLVIDGQQRNTTALLLLAAIRDVAAGRCGSAAPGGGGGSEERVCAALASRLDGVLFPNREGLEQWLAAQSAAEDGGKLKVQEGEALHFAALLPTYCDRASYFAATLPPRARATGVGEWRRPLEAKKFFIQEVQDHRGEQLDALAQAVLNKLEWLYFPIDLSSDRNDGTENLQVIFERLALREATVVGKPRRAAEAANMGAADFVRNLLLSSFRDEAYAVEMYRQRWLPIEKAATSVAAKQRPGNVANLLESMLDRFLKAQPEQPPRGKKQHWSPVGGQVYARFRQWLVLALATTPGPSAAAAPGANGAANGAAVAGAAGVASPAPASASGARLEDSAEVEQKTAELLLRLKDFALEHFGKLALEAESEKASLPEPLKKTEVKGKMPFFPAQRACNSWRCRTCSFSNSWDTCACTACGSARPSFLS